MEDRCPRCGAKLKAYAVVDGWNEYVRIRCPRCMWKKDLLYHKGKLVKIV